MSSLPPFPTSRHQGAANGIAPGHDEATPSQLDRIAAVNARSRRQARGNRAGWLAAVLFAVALMALAYAWFSDRAEMGEPAARPQPVGAATGVVPVAASPGVAQAPVASPTLPVQAGSELAVPPALPASVSAVDRVRQARARQEADARAMVRQQEEQLARARAEDQERQRREADRARALAEEASQRLPEPAPQRPQPAPEPKRNVQTLCAASSNFLSELICHSRECRKAEHRDDPTCIRLREVEEAQRRGGQQ